MCSFLFFDLKIVILIKVLCDLVLVVLMVIFGIMICGVMSLKLIDGNIYLLILGIGKG